MPPPSSSAQLSMAAGTLPSPPPLQLAQAGDRPRALLGCPGKEKSGMQSPWEALWLSRGPWGQLSPTAHLPPWGRMA